MILRNPKVTLEERETETEVLAISEINAMEQLNKATNKKANLPEVIGKITPLFQDERNDLA